MFLGRTRVVLHTINLCLTSILLLVVTTAVGYGVYTAKVRGPEIRKEINYAVASRVDHETDFINSEVRKTFKSANGLLNEGQKTIYTLNVSAMEAGKAAKKESLLLDELNPQITGAATNVNTVLLNANGLISHGTDLLDGVHANVDRLSDSSLKTINAFPPLIGHLDETVQTTNGLFQHEVKGSLLEFNGSMTEFHGVMTNANSTSKDVKDYAHKLTHPTVFEKAFTYTITGAGAAAKFFMP